MAWRGSPLVVPVMILLLGAPLAGCLDTFDRLDLDAAFGDAHLGDGRLDGRLLLHRLQGDPEWQPPGAPINGSFVAEPIVVEKPEPTLVAPGGVHMELDPLALPTYEFRLDALDHEALADATVTWSLLHVRSSGDRTILTSDEVFTYTPRTSGAQELRVEIGGRSGFGASLAISFEVVTEQTIHSKIYPFEPSGGGAAGPILLPDPTTMPNYDEMRDVFTLDVPAGALSVTTTFDGEHDPQRHGDDIDLGILAPAEQFLCTGQGSVDPRHTPADAFESLHMQSSGGTHHVMVGALPDDCGSWRYENTGPVPYTVTIRAGPTTP